MRMSPTTETTRIVQIISTKKFIAVLKRENYAKIEDIGLYRFRLDNGEHNQKQKTNT